MTKPLGYYTSYTPGQESYLEYLQQKYGSTLECFTYREKLWLIVSIASNLLCQSQYQKKPLRTEIQAIPNQVHQHLTPSDAVGLLSALIAQVLWR